MASIVDSFREVFSDRRAFLKLIILAIPTYYCYQLYVGANGDFGGFWFWTYVFVFFLFGFLIEVTNNVIDENDSVLPSMNPFLMAFDAIKGILAIGPLSLICCGIANYINSLINIIFWFDITLKILIWIVVVSIVITSFLLFCAKKKIVAAYNFPVMYSRIGDIIFVLIFFIIQLTIINIPTTGFIGYSIFVIFGLNSPLFAFFLAFAAMFNLAVAGHYMGQIHYEAIAYIQNNK